MPDALKAMDCDELPAGTTIGDYTVAGRVGEGGMATVYAADHPLIGRRVAIKVIRADLGASREAFERFLQEARAVIAIGHPNIVDVFTFGRLADGRAYFVMELLEGRTLAETLDGDGPLTLMKACDALIEMCDGLEAAHRAGVIHRDLKPQNVFLCAPLGHVKLLDFGIAKLIGKPEPHTPHTRPGVTIGTPDYISPEQARGREVEPSADVYSLGVVAFEMLTGQLPFLADNAADMMVMHLGAPPRCPSSVRPELPVAIDSLIVRMLAKETADRPTLAEVRAELLAIKRDPQAVPAAVTREVSQVAVESIWKRPRPSRRLAAGVAGLAALVLCGALVAPRESLLPSLVALAATPMPVHRSTSYGSVPMPVLQPPTFGVLVVDAKTPAVKILIDGEEKALEGGMWRATVTGRHTVVASAPGFRPVSFEVQVDAGRVVEVPVALERIARKKPRPVEKISTRASPPTDPWRRP